MNDTFLGVVAAGLYLVSGGLLGMRMSGADRRALVKKSLLIALVIAALILHAGMLQQTIFTEHGINLGFFNALSCTSWLIAVLLLITALVHPVENLGVVLLPFCAISIVLALSFSADNLLRDNLSWPMRTHIIVSILASAVFAMAAVQALLLSIQEYALRHRYARSFLREIPPLVTMESVLFQLLTGGFLFLSVALLSGFLFLEDLFAQHLAHKTLLSVLAWLVFAILLWGRWHFGWRGRTAIRWTLGGFFALMLAYFGSKLVLELILHR